MLCGMQEGCRSSQEWWQRYWCSGESYYRLLPFNSNTILNRNRFGRPINHFKPGTNLNFWKDIPFHLNHEYFLCSIKSQVQVWLAWFCTIYIFFYVLLVLILWRRNIFLKSIKPRTLLIIFLYIQVSCYFPWFKKNK